MKKITELTNEELDYWVAVINGDDPDNKWYRKYTDEKGETWNECSYGPQEKILKKCEQNGGDACRYIKPYSTNWIAAGELVEKFKVDLVAMRDPVYPEDKWKAEVLSDKWITAHADTPQRAIAMAVIASVYGEEIND